jgi:outer membrane protein assembly factor BamB
VLWGEKLFVTSGESQSGKRIVLCLNAADGRTLWKRELDGAAYKMHKRNSVATGTPTVDAERLYMSWATPDRHTILAMDHQGKTEWEADLGPVKAGHGFGISPIRFDDLVIAGNDQDGGGSLVALDCRTGTIRWQVPRKSGNATYATPCVHQPHGRPAELIFTNWQHGITSVDPKTGKVNWELVCFDPTRPERAIASPVMAGDLILGTCGFVSAQKHFVAVRPGNQPKEVWRVEKAVSYLPTPLVKGDRVFLCSEQGIASCLEASTGKLIWQERVGGSYSGSPVCAGDRIYCVADDGEVIVLAASDRFELLGRGSLGEPTQSTPAIAGGRIYFRTKAHLMSLGGKK